MVNQEEILENQSQIRENGRMAKKSGDSTISYWSGLHVFSILCCCGLAMSILTLIPRHNSLLDQSYWLEISIVAAPAYLIRTALIALDFIVLFENDSMITPRIFVKCYLANFLTWIVGYCTIYMIWKMILEYNHPMPLYNFILYFPTKIVSVVSVPLMLPREFSHDEESKIKLKNIVWFELGWLLASTIKGLVATSFEKLSKYFPISQT